MLWRADRAAARHRSSGSAAASHSGPAQQNASPLLRVSRGRACLPLMSDSVKNLSDILARLDAARKAAVAPAPSTTLVAVSKTYDSDAIRPVLEAGHRTFGENRVQEAFGKWPGLRSDYADVQLHLIGPLQSNKVREAVELFDTIHSLDRPKLAHALKAEIEHTGRQPVVLI